VFWGPAFDKGPGYTSAVLNTSAVRNRQKPFLKMQIRCSRKLSQLPFFSKKKEKKKKKKKGKERKGKETLSARYAQGTDRGSGFTPKEIRTHVGGGKSRSPNPPS
jgi:hypothetical protein